MRWIFRNQLGQIKGPFSTEEVVSQIRSGGLSGAEQINTFPEAGAWRAVSSEREFYTALIEYLADSPKTENELDAIALEPEEDQVFEETIIKIPDQIVEKKIPAQPLPTSYELPTPISWEELEAYSRGRAPKPVMPHFAKLIPVVLFAASSVFALLLLWTPEDRPTASQFKLMAPQNLKGDLSPEQISTLYKKGINQFLQDTLSGYSGAQRLFLRAIEGEGAKTGSPAQGKSLLCLTHFLMWPLIQQTDDDRKALEKAAKMIIALNPVSEDALICQATQLSLQGRSKEAESIVERGLALEESLGSFLFLKAELLFLSQKYSESTNWYLKALKEWQGYSRLPAMIAFGSELSGDFQKARGLLEQAVKAHPQSLSLKVLLGSLLIRLYGNTEKGLIYLSNFEKEANQILRPIRSRGYMGLASAEADRGNQRAATQFAKKAYQLDPSWSEPKDLLLKLGGEGELLNRDEYSDELEYIGDQYRRMGNCFSASAEYKVAFQKDPKNARVALKASKCLKEIYQSREALVWVQKAITAKPDFMESYLWAADLYSEVYDYEQAERVLLQGSEIKGSQFDILKGYSLLALRRNDFDLSLAYGERALKINDKDPDLLLIMGRAAYEQKDSKRAFSFVARSVELDPSKSDSQVLFAKVKYRLNGFQSAYDYLMELTRSFRLVVDYQLGIGEIFFLEERFNEAEDHFLQAVVSNPKNKEARLWLAKTYQKQGKLSEAYESFLAAATLDPSDPAPLYLAALIELERIDPDRAIAQLQRVVTTNPNYPLAHYYMGRANLLKVPPLPQNALELANREKKISPNLAEPYLLAAESLFLLNKFSDCAGEYQKATRIRDQGADVYVKMAQCYRKSGALDAAETMLELAGNRESGFAGIFLERGALFEAQGDRAAAVQSYKKFLLLAPNAPERLEIKRRIDQLERN